MLIGYRIDKLFGDEMKEENKSFKNGLRSQITSLGVFESHAAVHKRHLRNYRKERDSE